MSDFPVLNFQDFISFVDGKLITDSLKVAAVHGKSHDNVLKLIRRRVLEAGTWGVVNFNETLYIGSNGETYPMFTMTQIGYQFLVGRMTGKMAVQHQIVFIEAFCAMADYIDNQACGIRWRLDKLELEEKDSVRRGTIHGRGLRVRQLEDLILTPAIAALKDKLQPYLPMFDAPPPVQ
jgi:Rha family phage regulatory protein